MDALLAFREWSLCADKPGTHLFPVPQADGLLPKWQLFVAVTALFNSVQNLVTLKLTRRLYGLAPNGPFLHLSVLL